MSKSSMALDTALDFLVMTGGGSIDSLERGECVIRMANGQYVAQTSILGSNLKFVIKGLSLDYEEKINLAPLDKTHRRGLTRGLSNAVCERMGFHTHTEMVRYYGKFIEHLSDVLGGRNLLISLNHDVRKMVFVITSVGQHGTESILVSFTGMSIDVSHYTSLTDRERLVFTNPCVDDTFESVKDTIDAVKTLLG